MVLVSIFHKAHDAEKKTDGPRFQFLRILPDDRNHWARIVFEFLVAIRAFIRVQEIAEFNTTVGTFGFIHFRPLVKNFMVLRPVYTMKTYFTPSCEKDKPWRGCVPRPIALRPPASVACRARATSPG